MNFSVLRLFRFGIYALCFVFGAGLPGAVTVYAAPVDVSRPLSQAAGTTGGISLLSTPTTITLESSPNPAAVGQTITFIATVSPPPDGGTVAFKASGVNITGCEARPLTGGQATCASTALAAGVQPITAAYSGNAAYGASTSAGLYQGVYARPAVSTGWYHTCEPKPDGTLACWGTNNEGQITVPVPNADWVQVSAQGYHTCGLKAGGALACWGRNSEGENNVPDPNGDWVQVSAGFVHTCGLRSNGTLACWGQDDFGQIAVPNPNADWVQVSAGSYHTCGLKADGALACWGSGLNWVPAPNADWVQVSAGYAAICGVKVNGTLQCWGEDLFDDGKNIVPSPNENWVQVSTSNYHTCGLKSDGALLCWGRNDDGQCTVPAPNTDWVQVSTGSNHTCGLKADGTLRCWGANHSGQAPVITLWPVTLPDAVLNRGYSPPLSAYGGSAAPYTFTVTAGAVPSGLTLNASGAWSGVSTKLGVFNFTTQATDANNIAGRRAYTITVVAASYLPMIIKP